MSHSVASSSILPGLISPCQIESTSSYLRLPSCLHLGGNIVFALHSIASTACSHSAVAYQIWPAVLTLPRSQPMIPPPPSSARLPQLSRPSRYAPHLLVDCVRADIRWRSILTRLLSPTLTLLAHGYSHPATSPTSQQKGHLAWCIPLASVCHRNQVSSPLSHALPSQPWPALQAYRSWV